MVPAAFVILPRLPLTPNGKVDRKALPAPTGDAYRRGQYEPPQGEVEIALAQIWQSLLKVEQIGRDDDFFQLGGHSLLAVQMASRVRTVLGRELELREVFERPTLAALARALLTAAHGDEPIKPRADRSGPLPLSYMQQRLWFVDQLSAQASRAYHLGVTLRLEGKLDIGALRGALDRIVSRHEVLRSVFRRQGDSAVQVIVPESQGAFSLVEKDLSALCDAERERQLAVEIQEESGTGFDLSQGPLIRGRLLRQAAEEHVLLLRMHHIVSDGWSVGVLLRELSELYGSGAEGRASVLSPLPIQYADYARWQRQRLQGESPPAGVRAPERLPGDRLQEQLRYWVESLQGAPELLSLPTDHARPAQASYRGDLVPVVLEESLSEGLRQLSQRHGMTLFMTLYGAFAVLLSRLAGQEDVVIGTPVANRPRIELEDLIGFFVNTLALRCRVSGQMRVCELLQAVKRQTLSAYHHQEVPLEQVVEILRPHRSLSYNPLFQAVFALQNTPRSQWDLPGLKLSAPAGMVGMSTAQFDLMLSLQETRGRIVGVLNYARDLFERATIERWVECLRELLQGMVRDDQQPVAELALLNERQREQVLRQFNAWDAHRSLDQGIGDPGTRKGVDELPDGLRATDHCIHELFEEQVERTPDAVAVVYEEQSLTYAQLNARASQLAQYLKAARVEVQERVALWLPRSVELLIAQLAVLKCGASYVPLDIELPPARQQFVLQDCAARCVLCWGGGRPCELEGVDYIDVEQALQRMREVATGLATQDRGGGVHTPQFGVAGTPEWIAYVMYTSGSSGQPKGVEIPHRGIARLVRQNGYAQISAEDRIAFASNPAFDASTFEVWAALVNGAAVRIVPQQELLEGEQFAAGLKRDGVSVLWLTVGLFNQYATPLKELWGRLKYLLVGGDALDARVVRQVLRESAPRNLLNGYGPTETTTFALTCRVEEVGEQERSIPLGRPISQTQVYVLDEQGQPVPVGVWGEICIGGHGVARGYLGRPELTAERFVSDPFGEPGGRLYRTGDMGRWRADGQLEYQGRLDHQVKVRGYRIELGEIESQLRGHEQVGDAVVMVREDGTGHGTGHSTEYGTDPRVGEKRLVAYVTPRSLSPEHPDLTESADARGAQDQTTAAVSSNPARGQGSSPDVTPLVGVGSVDVDTLRTYLKERVPAYMVPAAFVVLPRLPLTPNGKVDRKALPTPSATAYRRGQYEPPQGEVEIALTQIWQSLLSVEQIGRDDDFFQLGGHSLLAVQMASRVRTVLERELALREVFERPTLAALARALLKAAPSDTPIQRVADRPDLVPLSLPQEQLWFLDQLNPDASRAYHIGTLLRLQGELDVAALRRALDRIVYRHESLRTVFRSEGQQAVQVIGPEVPFRLVEKDLSALEAEEREEQLAQEIQEEAQTRFDLSSGPLIRGRLVKQAADDYLLLLRMHHIISDGWSIGVLVKELSALYAAYRQGDSDPLAALTVQYADYTLWLTPRLQGNKLQEQLRYWQESLRGAPELLSLPTDRPRPAQASYRGDSVPVVLDESLSEGLRQLSQRHGTTLFMTLYSGFAVLLSRLSGQSDVVIGTPVANRPRVELEELIGLFVNMLALRCRINGQTAVGELLQEVKRQTLSAYSHQEVPLERVVEALQPQRSLSHSPIFQVMFVLQNTPRSQWELPGLKLSAPGVGGVSYAPFDLTLSLQEARGLIVGTLNYARDLFDRETLERWAECLQELLRGMVRDDQQPVAELPLLNERQRAQVLRQFNAFEGEPQSRECASELTHERLGAPGDEDRCIHELFEEQVSRAPDAAALVCEDQSLTYAQLNARANQLARYLKSQGVGPDQRVGLCMDRGPQMVIGLLGILKAGGAYVPLDPGYPARRLEYLVADAAPVMILTQERLKDLPGLSGARCGCVDSQWEQIQEYGQDNLSREDSGVTPRHLAYVIYTSGSTGEPKGVMASGAASVNRLLAQEQVQAITAQEICCQKTSIGFVDSVFETLGALLGGAPLVVADQEQASDVQQLMRLCSRYGVTRLVSVPSLAQAMLEAGAARDLKGLRSWTLSGEALGAELLRRLREALPECRILNLYGSSEVSADATWYDSELAADPPQPKGGVPIGRPLANTQVYVLDGQAQPVTSVPIGRPLRNTQVYVLDEQGQPVSSRSEYGERSVLEGVE